MIEKDKGNRTGSVMNWWYFLSIFSLQCLSMFFQPLLHQTTRHTRESGVHSYNNNKNAVAVNGLTDVCSLQGMHYLDKSVTIIMFKMWKVNILKKKKHSSLFDGALAPLLPVSVNAWTFGLALELSKLWDQNPLCL